MAFLTELTSVHWLILGGVLLILELLGTAGYLLWLGAAAIAVAAVTAIGSLGWHGQWLLFALLALFFTAGWWHWQRRHSNGQDAAAPLNQRLQHYIGREVLLLEPVLQGRSRVKLDDTVWSVSCDQALTAGSRVRIIAVDGTLLKVAAITAT